MTYLTKRGIKRNFLNLIKNSCKKPIANIFSGKRLEALTLKMNKCYSLTTFTDSIALGVLANAIGQKKEISIPIEKEGIKLVTDDISCKKIQKNQQAKENCRINSYVKVARYTRLIYKCHFAIYLKQLEFEKLTFTLASKK